MKPLVCRIQNAIKIRAKLFGALAKYAILQTTAYAFNNWGNLISTSFYTVTYVVFLDVLFSNTDSLAGYSYNEALFMFFVGQLSFYLNWNLNSSAVRKMIDDIKTGTLDLILSKPIPVLWYLFCKGLSFYSLIFDCLIPLSAVLVILLLKGGVSISGVMLLRGTVVFLTGMIVTHSAEFIASLVAFSTGEGRRVALMVSELTQLADPIPYQALSGKLKMLGITVLPILIQTILSTSYLLGKTTSLIPLAIALITATCLFVTKIVAWRIGLRYYSSASS